MRERSDSQCSVEFPAGSSYFLPPTLGVDDDDDDDSFSDSAVCTDDELGDWNHDGGDCNLPTVLDGGGSGIEMSSPTGSESSRGNIRDFKKLDSCQLPEKKNKRILRNIIKSHNISKKIEIEVSGHTFIEHGFLGSLITDPYHTILAMNVRTQIVIFSLIYIFFWIIFAPVYMILSEECNLESATFLSAIYYSQITMSTIGFGTPDMQFNECWAALVVIMIQTLVGLFVNASMLGVLYTKLSRSQNRGLRVSFSKKAVIRCIRGKYHFMFQVVDTQSSCTTRNLIETHVRCYAVRNAGYPTQSSGQQKGVFFQQHAMRLSHPDDEMGGFIFIALPSMVSHQIDPWSPLFPEHMNQKLRFDDDRDMFRSYQFPHPILRNPTLGSYLCEVCGEVYDTKEQLKMHQISSAVDDRMSGHHAATLCKTTGESFPTLDALRKYVEHEEFDEEAPESYDDIDDADQKRHSHVNHLKYLPKENLQESQCKHRPDSSSHMDDEELTMEKIKEHLSKSNIEIIVLVEGIVNLTSSTSQAVHSYSMNDGEIMFDSTFVPCVGRGSDGRCVLNMDLFNTIADAPKNATRSRSTPSH